MKEEKIKVCLSVSRDLFQRYRQFLAKKYGEVRRGLISSEIENAIAVYMAEHIAHTHTRKKQEIRAPNPTPKIQRVREGVKDYLKYEFGYERIYQVPRTQVEMAIAMTRGSDPRTVRKWMESFEHYKLVCSVGGGMVEFL